MGLLDRIRKRETVIDEKAIDDALLRALLKGETVTRDIAVEIPIIASCLDKVCNTFASVPIKLYKNVVKPDGKRMAVEVEDERVKLINDDTNDTLDGFQFKKALCEDYLMGKGGYAYIKKIKNTFKGLYYVSENHVQIIINSNPIYKNYEICVNGENYKDFQFIKVLRNTKDGASGKGLVEQISRALQTAYERLKYELNLTLTGGSRKGFIQSEKHLDQKAIETLKKAWEQYYSGNANTVILNDGLKFQEASNSSQQNEINEKNRTFIAEIQDIFHISDNYIEFVKDAVIPILNAFVTALNRDLLLEKEKEEYYFAYDTSELLKGSLKERYDAYAVAIQNGFKTRNEIRYLENDNAINGLDFINLSLGSVLLDANTGTIYTPNTNETASI